MESITVAQLMMECAEQVKKGNGSKHIILSNDDEGNGFHELFYGFTPIEKYTGCMSKGEVECLMPYGVKPSDNIVILG